MPYSAANCAALSQNDPHAADVLWALSQWGALTAVELTRVTGLPSSLRDQAMARLSAHGWINATTSGRHTYYALADTVPEAMVREVFAQRPLALSPPRWQPGPRDPALRKARVCYGHLAGELGVALCQRLWQQGWLKTENENWVLTAAGRAFCQRRGILTQSGAGHAVKSHRRDTRECRPCLDWSQRRPHVAGALGRALLDYCLAQNWARRIPGQRVIVFSAAGEAALRDL